MGLTRARTEVEPGTREPAVPWWHHALGLWLPLVALTVLTIVLLSSR